MIEIIKVSFALILLYLIFILFPLFKAGLDYDIEKKKISSNYDGNHTAHRGRLTLPFLIDDNDTRITKYTVKYNKFTKIFWWSYGIGIPLLFFLGNRLNEL